MRSIGHSPYDRMREQLRSRMDPFGRFPGQRLDELEQQVRRMKRQLMSTTKELLDQLEKQNTVSAGHRAAVNAKLDEMNKKITELLAGQIDPDTQARIDAAFAASKADTDADAEATAILKGTPASDTPVSEPGNPNPEPTP